MFKLEYRNPLHACQLLVNLARFEQVLVDLGHCHQLALGGPHLELGEHHVHFQREELVPLCITAILGSVAPLIVAPHQAKACELM